MSEQQIHKTDVLVIGGGMAGCFAAIKARENGADVLLVEKGYVSSSGQTPYADSYCIFNEEWGDDLDAWMHQVNSGGDYLNIRDWTEIVFRESHDRYLDMLSYGIEFAQKEDGTLLREANPQLGPLQTSFLQDKTASCKTLRQQVLKSGAKIIDRLMITDLVKQEDKVVGAVGISVSEADFHVIEAKSVIICTGAVGLKATGWPNSNLTADGDMMAYRVGAEITGKEFNDVHSTSAEHPVNVGVGFLNKPTGNGPPPATYKNAKGEMITGLSLFHLSFEYEAHKGNAPISWVLPQSDKRGEAQDGGDRPPEMVVVAGATAGMSTHKSEGIWPSDTHGSVGIPGLFAAGDSLGVMLSGGAYSLTGAALSGSSVIGARAGHKAAEHAANSEAVPLDQDQLDTLRAKIYAPLKRQGGFSPSWVLDLLKNTLVPYFTLIIKHEDRLKAALTQIEFYRDQLVPKLRAEDAHELRLAIEAKNLVCNAEMKLRASLERKESRGTHYREDYPRRDDDEFLSWIKIKDENGRMTLSREPVPQKWRPDPSKPESERYLFEFPVFPQQNEV
jgi:succinate dehydrogenase/fumarate reductase flavoprotein subunit